MKTLKQIQEENRKFIIMANNPTAKTYEEALEMELGFGCQVILREYSHSIIITHESILKGHYDWGNENSDFHKYIKLLHDDTEEYVQKIIGKPLTLDRVLIAYDYYDIGYHCSSSKNILRMTVGKIYNNLPKDVVFNWDLTKKTLEEQSEETQRKFNELINEI